MKNNNKFGKYFDNNIKHKNIYNNEALRFKVPAQLAENIIKLFALYSDIKLDDSNIFYFEKQLDKVYFHINVKNIWLEQPINAYFETLKLNNDIEWY